MIAYITSTNEINKILRNELIIQSELDPSQIRNSLSVNGETLQKEIEKQIYESIDHNDTLILFELQTRDSVNDISLTTNDDNILYYKSYNFKLVLYGNDSIDTGNKITARFRSENVRNKLYDQGIYLESISNPITINEFINDTIWFRTDINIYISCAYNILPISKNDDIENVSDLIILKNKGD